MNVEDDERKKIFLVMVNIVFWSLALFYYKEDFRIVWIALLASFLSIIRWKMD
jgi:hypothetical protein